MTKKSYTAKEQIVMFLRKVFRELQGKNTYILRNSSLQTKLPDWVAEVFGTKERQSPESYARAWRELREKGGYELRKYNLEVEDVEMPNSAEKHFRIKLLAPLKPIAKPVVPDPSFFKEDDPDLKQLKETFGDGVARIG